MIDQKDRRLDSSVFLDFVRPELLLWYVIMLKPLFFILRKATKTAKGNSVICNLVIMVC